MPTPVLLVIYCLLIVLGSLAGGWIPIWVRMTHTRMQLALSFIGGAMLGVGLLHLLPHAFYELHSIHQTVGWLLGGFLLMFFIERVFQFHHHDAPADIVGASLDAHGQEEHEHDHDHAHAHGHGHAAGPPLKWGAALAGLTLHSVLEGMALAAGVAAERFTDPGAVLAGLVVFLVVALHKPFDSMTLGTMMAMDHAPAQTRHTVNAVYALTVPLGVLVFFLGVDSIGEAQDTIIGSALAFAAGTFLCISTSDLLPELQFHSHDRLKLSAALLGGIIVAAGLVALEESWHDHGRGHSTVNEGHQHSPITNPAGH
jgi:zinc and cadmium transporter